MLCVVGLWSIKLARGAIGSILCGVAYKKSGTRIFFYPPFSLTSTGPTPPQGSNFKKRTHWSNGTLYTLCWLTRSYNLQLTYEISG